jgi:putative protease
MDAAKSMGELVGSVTAIGRGGIEVRLGKGVVLGNGDGFSFVSRTGNVEGFRGDVCSGSSIRCRVLPSLFVGAQLYRNINAAFEKEIERQTCTRVIRVKVSLEARFDGTVWLLSAKAVSEDGRTAYLTHDAGVQKADNHERMLEVMKTQMAKSAGHYRFTPATVSAPDGLPFMSASSLNGIRRTLAEMLDGQPAGSRPLLNRELSETSAYPSDTVTYKQNVSNRLSVQTYRMAGASSVDEAYELSHQSGAELMRTKYCIRYELGICPVHQKEGHQSLPAPLRNIKADAPLFLLNNGRRLALGFDCRRCEMTVKES